MIDSVAYFLDEAAVDKLAEVLTERYTLHRGGPVEDTVTLLDSFDGRFFESGVELHYRQGQGSDGPRTRGQLHWIGRERQTTLRPLSLPQAPVTAVDLPPGPWQQAVADRLGIRSLLEVVTWDRQATELRFLDRREKTVVRGQLVGVESGSVRLHLLHLRGVRGYGEAFRAVRASLDGLGVQPCDRSEGQIAASGVGRSLGSYSNRLDMTLNPAMRADLAMRLIHGRLLDIVMANLPGVRKGLDIEFLHDFRVALRKTRTGLAQVRRVFPAPVVAHFKEELRWLFRETGYSRDLDVFLLAMPSYQELLPARSRVLLLPLQEFLEEQRVFELGRLDKLLGSRRVSQLLSDWRRFLESELPVVEAPPEALRPIEKVARQTIERLWKRVIRGGQQIDAKSPDSALHALRVQIKKLRYGLEFFRQVLTEETDTAIRETKKLQENLGRFADYSSQGSHLQRFATDLSAERPVSPPTLLAMGQLIPHFEARQAKERKRFHRTFERFSSPTNQQLMKRILE